MTCCIRNTSIHCITKYKPSVWCSSVKSCFNRSSWLVQLHHLFISSSRPTKQSVHDKKSRAVIKTASVGTTMGVQVPEGCLWSQKRKKRWAERVKKKLSTLTFPPFPSLFVSLWTCSPWMRHKGSRGERPQDRRDCHTQIFSLEPAVGATNPMSTLP